MQTVQIYDNESDKLKPTPLRNMTNPRKHTATVNQILKTTEGSFKYTLFFLYSSVSDSKVYENKTPVVINCTGNYPLKSVRLPETFSKLIFIME